MCLLLKEKSPSNKDEIGFFPCITAHVAPLPSRPVRGCGRERGNGSARFVCLGMLPPACKDADVWGQSRGLGDKLRARCTLCHPRPPAALVPFRLVGCRSCWGWCKTAQPQLPTPSRWDAPDLGVPLPGIAWAGRSRSLGWQVEGCARLPGCFPGTPSGVTSPRTRELPETGPPRSGIPARVSQIWRLH